MKLKLSFASFFAALVMLAIGLLFLVLTGCSSKKNVKSATFCKIDSQKPAYLNKK